MPPLETEALDPEPTLMRNFKTEIRSKTLQGWWCDVLIEDSFHTMFVVVFAFLYYLLAPAGYASPLRPIPFNGFTSLSSFPTDASARSNGTASGLPLASVTCNRSSRGPNIPDCLMIETSRAGDPELAVPYLFGFGGNYTGPLTWRWGDCELGLHLVGQEQLLLTLQEIFAAGFYVALSCSRPVPPTGGFGHFRYSSLSEIRATRSRQPHVPHVVDPPPAQNVSVSLSTPSTPPFVKRGGIAINSTSDITCYTMRRLPNIPDCLLLESQQSLTANFDLTYTFGRGGNYIGSYTWQYDQCEFELSFPNSENKLRSTIREVFSWAILVALECSKSTPPRGGVLALPGNPGSALIFALRPPQPRLQSTIDSSFVQNGTVNATNPAVLSKNCRPNAQGPVLADCFTLFIDETQKHGSWTLQTFGPRGTYAGPYSWSHESCQFQLDMKDVPLLSTTLAWIFQAAVDVVVDCSKRLPPEGGYVRLDHPHRGVEISVFNPSAAAVSQQKRALPHPGALAQPLATPSNFITLPYITNLTTGSPVSHASPTDLITAPIADFTSPSTPNLTASYIGCPSPGLGPGGIQAPDYVDCFTLYRRLSNIPHSETSYTFGRGGSYTGPYEWHDRQCEFSLRVLGDSTWRATIADVFDRAEAVWVSCEFYEPPRPGYVIYTGREGTRVTIWVARTAR